MIIEAVIEIDGGERIFTLVPDYLIDFAPDKLLNVAEKLDLRIKVLVSEVQTLFMDFLEN